MIATPDPTIDNLRCLAAVSRLSLAQIRGCLAQIRGRFASLAQLSRTDSRLSRADSRLSHTVSRLIRTVNLCSIPVGCRHCLAGGAGGAQRVT